MPGSRLRLSYMEKQFKHPEGATGLPNDDIDRSPLLNLAGPLLRQLESNFPLPISEQIAGWEAYYSSCAPYLPPRLYADYTQVEGGWRSIAESRIFPKLPDLLPGMKLALNNLRKICRDVCNRATTMLGLKELPERNKRGQEPFFREDKTC